MQAVKEEFFVNLVLVSKRIAALIITMFLIESTFGQINIVFDFENNVVLREETRANKEKKVHKYWLKEFRHKVFKPLKVGDYITFEIRGLEKDQEIDSIAAAYEFLDLNLRDRDYFTNYLTSNLSQLNEGGSESPQNKTDGQDSKSDPTGSRSSGRFPASIGDDEDPGSTDELIYSFEIYTRWFADSSGIEKKSLDLHLFEALDLVVPEDTISNDLDTIHAIAKSKIDDAILSGATNEDAIIELLVEETGIEVAAIMLQVMLIEEKLGINLRADAEAEVDENESGTDLRTAIDEVIYYRPLQIQNRDLTRIFLTTFKDGKEKYKRRYQFHSKSGFKVDFSVGIGVSFLKDHNFILRPSATKDTVYFANNFIATDSIVDIKEQNEIVQQGDGDFFAGVSVLAHFYTRIAARFNLGLTSGLMINTESRINYLLGGSFIAGKEQRLVATVGMAIGKVNRLSDRYKNNRVVPLSTTTAETMEVWDTGLYLGLSNNF